MTPKGHLDIRDLTASPIDFGACPVKKCTEQTVLVDSQWGKMPFCPAHQIRIHRRTRTFVYYNGPDAGSKRDAALRNISFECEYFRDFILGNAAKAESHRIAHETSEDALTWNVFARLARSGKLASVLSTFTKRPVSVQPELYLWGLKIDLNTPSAPICFPALLEARDKFERGIRRFLTEPDIMLYVPGQVLLLIEAKFTSGNTIASDKTRDDVSGQKPKSRKGLIQRYPPSALRDGALLEAEDSEVFYSQLYRNLVFAIHMADELGVEWGLVSLVSQTRFQRSQSKAEFMNPTGFIQGMLPENARNRFLWYSWEQLYQDHVKGQPELAELGEYMYYKSANGLRAFSI